MTRDLSAHDAFNILEQRSTAIERLSVRPTGLSTDQGEITFAVDASGNRHLLLPVREGTTVQEDRRSAGVQIHDTTLVDQGLSRRFVDVVCLLAHLGSLFDILIDEMLDELESGADHPAGLVASILERWRELLDRGRSSALSRERLAGVAGELLVLSQLAEHHPVNADWWTGPLGHVHDIVWPGHSLEVKTTLSRDRSIVEINGLEQLADTPDRALHLVFVRLLQDPAGDVTVPGLIDGLAGHGVDRFELLRRAAGVGVAPQDLETYRQVPFTVLEVQVYSIGPGFPRITEASLTAPLPAGISNVGYSIDLSTVKAAAMAVDATSDLIEIVDRT